MKTKITNGIRIRLTSRELREYYPDYEHPRYSMEEFSKEVEANLAYVAAFAKGRSSYPWDTTEQRESLLMIASSWANSTLTAWAHSRENFDFAMRLCGSISEVKP